MAPRTPDKPPMMDACIGCDQVVSQRDDLGLCPACAAKLDRDMMRDRDWERSWTAWHTPTDQREALRAQVVARYGARYELIVPRVFWTVSSRRWHAPRVPGRARSLYARACCGSRRTTNAKPMPP